MQSRSNGGEGEVCMSPRSNSLKRIIVFFVKVFLFSLRQKLNERLSRILNGCIVNIIIQKSYFKNKVGRLKV